MLFSSKIQHRNKFVIFWQSHHCSPKHMLLQISFQQFFKGCTNLNVFGDKVSCLWKLSPKLLYPKVFHCRYIIKYTWNLHGYFILKVLINPRNAKFKAASSSSTSFLWETQSRSVLNLLPSMLYLCKSANRSSQWMIHKPTISALGLPSAVTIKPSSSNANIPLEVLLPLHPHEISCLKPEWVK